VRVLRGSWSSWDLGPEKSSVTIGVLDGVHRGHQALIAGLDSDLVRTVLTFDPHPIEVFHPGANPRLITTIEERIGLLESWGIDQVGILDLTEIKDLGPEEFVDEVLVRTLRVEDLVAGPDFRFGKERTGDVELLRTLGKSREGCIRFLNNLVKHPGCGTFSPQTSYVVLDSEEQVCGVLLTSKISPDTGMIPQISVRNDCQGKGIGSYLLRTYFKDARESGLERITLSVSEANEGACRLYDRLGFQKTRDFHAFVRNF